MSRRVALVVALIAAAGTPPIRAATPTVALAAHHAVYDLTLSSVQGGETVAASGRMTYQVSDACTSWATQQRLDLHTVTRDGGATELISDYATLEGKDGRHLAFDMKQRSNGVVTQQLRGDAVMDPSGSGRIRYTLPRRATVTLPAGTLFPMAHTAAIILAAHDGLRSIAPSLFDGTGAEGAQDTYVTILGWKAAPTMSSQPSLSGLGSSRVHVAFYSRTPSTITPDYESAMRYFDNGVADQLSMNFGGFTMQGALHAFTLSKRSSRC